MENRKAASKNGTPTMPLSKKLNKDIHKPSISFSNIRKRDGRMVPFDLDKIAKAIASAGRGIGPPCLGRLAKNLDTEMPTVEQIHDIVEEVLLASLTRSAPPSCPRFYARPIFVPPAR